VSRKPNFSLDELTPEKRGRARTQPMKAGDPIRSQTIRLPASVWQKLRMLAAAKGSTSIGEVRAALEGHFEREWPQVRARMDAVETA
jgi:hypothetical protein